MTGHDITIDGHRFWYADHGSGEPLVMLHPGGVDSRAFDGAIEAFGSRFRAYTVDRRGHGRTPDIPGPMTPELMAADTEGLIDALGIGPVLVLGYSDGAIVGLHLALRRPDLVRKLAFVAGVFHRDGWHPSAIDPDLEPPEFFRDAYGEVSPDGPDHYPVVADKLREMHSLEPTLTTSDLSEVEAPVLVMIGDDDEVELEHAIEMYRAIPGSELAVVPGTSHGLLVEKPDLFSSMVIDFLDNDPPPTVAPIRRAPLEARDI